MKTCPATLLSALVLVAAAVLCGGCGSSDVHVAAKKLVNPVEKALGPPILINKPNADDNTKSDAFSATFFFKIDKQDEAVYDATFATCKNEVREQITLTLLQATLAERQDPALYAIKQRVNGVVNGLLGAEFVKDVIVTDVAAITYQN